MSALTGAPALAGFLLGKYLPLRLKVEIEARSIGGREALRIEPGSRITEADMANFLGRALDVKAAAGTFKVWRASKESTLLLYDNGALRGVAVFRANVEASSTPLQPFLYFIAVDPSLRGRGYGSVLMEEAMRVFGKAGYIRMHLIAENDSPAAKLYRRLGFEVCATLPWRRSARLFTTLLIATDNDAVSG